MSLNFKLFAKVFMLYFYAVKLADELDRTEEIFSMDNYSACILHCNPLPSYR